MNLHQILIGITTIIQMKRATSSKEPHQRTNVGMEYSLNEKSIINALNYASESFGLAEFH